MVGFLTLYVQSPKNTLISRLESHIHILSMTDKLTLQAMACQSCKQQKTFLYS